ncbi:WXG100 family type VII secretion target [Mycolicibacterium sp. CBMA 226]|uniref:WXG100 family type VII secretion target n=1 Tax=Mycolicibacterium sp. CBMA 226 TaxID=2606611 RepID=UPI0012DD457A|nr:hypothetical protein [Mycolicibacterium sp. CBMA 226]MUL78869.1 hypothetical protein [Mycolicibacterium sp. CBMA 226]QGW61168.1 hypothetical protein ICEMyc226_00136 [Mycolicibacterium sp.]
MPDLYVTPAQLRATSNHLAEVSGEMSAILNDLMSNTGGTPWGDDSIGHSFANGTHGYLGQEQWVKNSIQAKTNLLNDYATGLRTAADTLEQQDQP